MLGKEISHIFNIVLAFSEVFSSRSGQGRSMLCGNVSGHDVTVGYDSQDGPAFIVEIRLSSGATIRHRISSEEISQPQEPRSAQKRKQHPEGKEESQDEGQAQSIKRRRFTSSEDGTAIRNSESEDFTSESDLSNINNVLPPEVSQ